MFETTPKLNSSIAICTFFWHCVFVAFVCCSMFPLLPRRSATILSNIQSNLEFNLCKRIDVCVCARVFLCLKPSQPKFFGFQLNLFDFKRVFHELTFLMDLIDSNSIFHVHRENSILCRLHTFQIDTKTASVFLFNSKLDTFVPFEL